MAEREHAQRHTRPSSLALPSGPPSRHRRRGRRPVGHQRRAASMNAPLFAENMTGPAVFPSMGSDRFSSRPLGGRGLIQPEEADHVRVEEGWGSGTRHRLRRLPLALTALSLLKRWGTWVAY